MELAGIVYQRVLISRPMHLNFGMWRPGESILTTRLLCAVICVHSGGQAPVKYWKSVAPIAEK